MKSTNNLRILERKGLIPPVIMCDELPVTEKANNVVNAARQGISDIVHGKDDRLVVLCGPCSIHDYDAAMDYAHKLKGMIDTYQDKLVIIMRVYFEKPRTTVGWKGFINDPDLDGSFEINKGLRQARQLLLDINNLGVPCGTEFLDTISPQYVTDLISWGAIGARTTESQVHRELSSGLSCPIGFKNGTEGSVQVAVDAVGAASAPHHFLGITEQGNTAIFATSGNHDTHVILRGGKSGTNYDVDTINDVAARLQKAKLPHKVMVDCSHGNSLKDFRNQVKVAQTVAEHVSTKNPNVMGVMLESHLFEGNQSIDATPLKYGVSVTDSCMGWEMTEEVVAVLAGAIT
jgi:3-deoxy-7-phosphoheptulonate synthase